MMGAVISLFRSSTLGFDLDTMRPWFKDAAAADAFMEGKAIHTVTSSNWNKIGDPMIVPLSFTEASMVDIGIVTLGTANGYDTRKYWFRVRDVFVNETNRTELVYDIDYLQTFAYYLSAGHIDRIPKLTVQDNLTGRGRGIPLNPRRWLYDSGANLFPYGTQVVIVATKATLNGSTVEGPVYFYGSCRWVNYGSGQMSYLNPLKWLVDQHVLAAGDIVNAWAVPGLFHSTNEPTDGNFQYWHKVYQTMPQGSPWYWLKWTDSTPLAHVERTFSATLPDGMKSGLTYPAIDSDPEDPQYDVLNGTDTVRGLLSGICDERGNILFTFKDKTFVYNRFYCAVNISMASCEVDIVLNGASEGFISGHTTDFMVTYSCRPIDVIANSWAEYLFRQRDADIENRKLQNEAGLVGGMANAGSGALMGAAMGSVVPGIGTAAGAIAGGVTAIVGSAVNYGVQSVYGDKMQRVTDKMYQLAQDKVAVNGMITSYQLALQQTLHLFQLRVDPTTMSEIEQQLVIEGQMDDQYVPNIRNVMTNFFTADEFRPFAGTCEVGFAMPSAWKKTISAQLAAGARYKKFGTW